ncbi:MAG: deoxyguanosinetriphosphate triphosphohydrolase [Mobiluncus porci]|uniref:Deoxyguanosinetriphosphate triphosphohydrolase n=1 Tax=Mobiluncus porci TaxID=2652278 RepID=A0A7K0K427_9ACTO|nr:MULTISPECIES: deoxyguanosinetriphosphate triphosphohydrolase [Mobiluncus]MCI6584553.1 deoxyguanosinetriphosphate triphosphohydrolase [Mobiluncus sp.]MDD7540839.1 deoxyguanosinetriphosphate triphosphohydrolase [Mobiluncus porci]MDY5749203.1 deoxyguanosinetriphosphate triphosphohydrolase [Mobiluncus porci]MST50194.1 deoxyguanosinetriphosphate triphosphohydrolase [Mobiluncus porci]
MSETGIYPPEVHERFVTETHKRGNRTDFERDRARILHSSALRRLGEKTQVLGPIQNDFSRTRLTHSLEVAQVGRELGKGLGCDPDVVDAACLAHDLGHPPFGHSGERVLDGLAKDIGGFEGNAQTLRLVTRLEPKVVTDAGEPAGLNLTRATLDAIAKYPWCRGEGPSGTASPKFGVYSEDTTVFEWLRAGAPEGWRCLEAQVMDLSDDIAYSVHDVEDAVALGTASLGDLEKDPVLGAVVEATEQWYTVAFDPARSGAFTTDDIAAAYQRLRQMPFWLEDPVTDYRSQAALKDMTSQLIGRFCWATHEATREQYGEDPLSRYEANLVVPRDTRAEILLLKGIAVFYVMAPRETTHDHLSQKQLLSDLVWALLERQENAGSGEGVLQEPFLSAWRRAEDHPRGRDAGRLRAVIDQVASLTDVSASAWHARLVGMFTEPV